MTVLSSSLQIRELTARLKKAGKTIGVVPTMGALHEGHFSLVRQSLLDCDATIVTIFVNPTQFAAGEDLATYPRTLKQDMHGLAELGDVHVFAPDANMMYPDGFSTEIVPPKVAQCLEGEFRPDHFSGVATVVLKLLNLTRADTAFFGQKDYQQSRVIQAIVDDLNVNVDIQICPIMRESDGLAMSSRNRYLSPQERETALALQATLRHVESLIRDGQNDGYEIVTEMRQMLIDAGVDRVDYATVANAATLETVDFVELPVVALIAAYVGQTRLIDNVLIE